MGFLSSKSATKNEPSVPDKSPETPSARADDFYADLIARRPGLVDEKLKLHERIIDEFNLTALEKMPPDELAKQVRTYVGDYVRRESLSLNQKELDIFSNEIVAEMTGYGPLEPLLKDPTVTDILINTHRRCFIERFGQLQETKVHFKDEAHLLRIINRIVSAIGRRVDESSPMVDARLRDGSRVNVAVRPIAIDGHWFQFENLPSASSTWTGSLKSEPCGRRSRRSSRRWSRARFPLSSLAALGPARRQCSTRCRISFLSESA